MEEGGKELSSVDRACLVEVQGGKYVLDLVVLEIGQRLFCRLCRSMIYGQVTVSQER